MEVKNRLNRFCRGCIFFKVTFCDKKVLCSGQSEYIKNVPLRSDDNRPFPIQQSYQGKYKDCKVCSIPWWLAEVAYKEYSQAFGTSQSLQRLADRGGFGREELINLIKNVRSNGRTLNKRDKN